MKSENCKYFINNECHALFSRITECVLEKPHHLYPFCRLLVLKDGVEPQTKDSQNCIYYTTNNAGVELCKCRKNQLVKCIGKEYVCRWYTTE